ncbi:MAG: hypothetical protein A3F17_00895 [Gammaproteobacteria bacterium RIFCSPHIGHO2_12_FULL_41_15]|nr:MAG: hypothetical protein A3F17_00895 [Gammaproteobacteria bacterium RIFCSPHIGHO2_12_FULL_41_15]
MQAAQLNQKKPFISRYVDEDKDFWKKHMASYSNSGLTKTAYCKANQVNYARFFYWTRKLSGSSVKPTAMPSAKKQSSIKTNRLLPIQITHEIKPHDSVLCTVILKNGCTLRIHNQQSLMHILAIWG